MKKYFRITAIIIILILLASVFTGCGSDADDTPNIIDEDESKFVFVPDFTSLSALAGDLPNINNITIAKDTLYFTSTNELEGDVLFRTTRIFTLDLDEFNLSYLTNYTAPPLPPEVQGGGVYIHAIKVDADGNLWVVEESNFIEFDFPFGFDLNDAETDEILEHISSHESSYTIRKLDNTGAELKKIDISHILTSSDWFSLLSFHVDDDGNLIIGLGKSITILNIDGETLFSLETDDLIMPDSLIKLSDGRIAFFGLNSTMTVRTLRVINVQRKAWGDSISLPINVHNVFSGFNEYLVIINDGVHLSGIHDDTGRILPIISWADGIGVPVGLGNVTFMSDERVLLTTTSYDSGSGESYISRTELITLKRTPRDELPERITLTLAATWLPPYITSVIAEFNRTNAFYQIEVNTIELGWLTMNDDLHRLALDIIIGKGPDIIQLDSIPFKQWAAQGLFVDLYEFIDDDPHFDRDDLLDVMRRNAETENRLYQIFPGFTVNTMIGNPDVVGNEPGWTFGELIEVLEANPYATNAFGVWSDGMSIFQQIFMNNIDSFVNWETGIVDFDNDNFIEFLEFAYELRRAFNWWSDNRVDGGIVGTFGPSILREKISSGDIIIETIGISTFNSPYIIQQYFGEDFVFKGYPTNNGSGNSLNAFPRFAISSKSENKTGAWEFIRMILSEEWQSVNIVKFDFPTNRKVFEERLTRARLGDESVHWASVDIPPDQLPDDTSVYVDMTLALIDSAEGLLYGYDPLLDIIFESLNDLFAGRTTEQDAARIIQNRAAIFVAEQFG